MIEILAKADPRPISPSMSTHGGTMMVAKRRFVIAIALAFGLATGIAQGGSLIEFPNVSEQAKPEHLLGYLARPDGPGPFPAVVVLHGCSGFLSHYPVIADALKREGYVAFAVDSLGPRGIERCRLPFVEQGTDAYAALDYLSQQRFVDADRVAVLGYSMGGTSALRDVERRPGATMFKHGFRAAIAYYPWCGDSGATMGVPTMILIGASDDRTPAELCRKLAAQPHEGGPAIDLTVYPGAWAKVQTFLAANLGSGTADQPDTR